MSNEEVLKKITEIVSDKLFVTISSSDTLSLDTDLCVSFGADDVDLLDIVVAIENEYDIDLDFDNVDSVRVVKDLLDYTMKALNTKE